MPIFIALYRGLNLGGRTSVKMDALRALHSELGHERVQSYIQSGNIVFSARGTARSITKRLAEEFAGRFEFPARVVVLEARRWADLIAGNPFEGHSRADPKQVHLAICEGKPSASGLDALLAKTGGREVFIIRDSAIYLHAPAGFGTSKFAAGMERAAGVSLTSRNWRTVLALADLADSMA